MNSKIVSISLAAFALALWIGPVTRAGQSATSTSASAASTTDTAASDSPLVQAAKAGAKNRGQKSKMSITNEDVKKSKGKLIQTTSKPLTPLTQPNDAEAMKNAKLSAEASEKAKKAAQERVDRARKEVESLESELRRIEETYYNEDDPDYREDVIQKRFNDTKQQLEKAREELADARKAYDSPPPPTP